MFSCEFCEISKNTFSHRRPLVAASASVYIISIIDMQKQPPEVCPWKKVFLEISQNSQESTSARASFLIKLQPWGLQLY